MFDFEKLLEKHIAREHTPKRIGKYYPSEVGSCLRKVWYSYMHPKPVDIERQKVFEVGDMIHAFVVDVLKNAKDVKLLKAEMPFNLLVEGFRISGRVDDLVLLSIENKKLLLEVKSTNNIRRIEKPFSNHVLQLQFYMYATEVHDGALLYIEKNTLKSKTFHLQFSRKEAERALGRFKALHRCLMENKLPPAEGREKDDMKGFCKFCEYKEKCEEDEA